MFGQLPARRTTPKPNSTGIPVFVYGTLMSGQPNHWLMEGLLERSHAVLMCERATCSGVMIANIGRLPAAYLGGYGGPSLTYGELYCVTADGIGVIDQLEGHPHFYSRTQVHIGTEDAMHLGYVYLGPSRSGLAGDDNPIGHLAGSVQDGILVCDWRVKQNSDVPVFLRKVGSRVHARVDLPEAEAALDEALIDIEGDIRDY